MPKAFPSATRLFDAKGTQHTCERGLLGASNIRVSGLAHCLLPSLPRGGFFTLAGIQLTGQFFHFGGKRPPRGQGSDPTCWKKLKMPPELEFCILLIETPRGDLTLLMVGLVSFIISFF